MNDSQANLDPLRPVRLSPKKLLLSKWTAVAPTRKEKHFLVTKVLEPEPPGTAVTMVEVEAVMTRRVQVLHWRELTDATKWRRGWER